MTAQLPLNAAVALSFFLTFYGMAGLRRGPEAVARSCAVSTLMSLIAVQVMHACAVAAPTQDAAFMLSIAWTAVQVRI